MTKNFIAESREQFDMYLEQVFNICVDHDHPLKISAAFACDDGTGTLMFGYYDNWPDEHLNTLRTTFSIRRYIFEASDDLKERLLDHGLLVYYDSHDETELEILRRDLWSGKRGHRIICQWGKYNHEFRFRGSEEEAVLKCIRYGGMLRETQLQSRSLHESFIAQTRNKK